MRFLLADLGYALRLARRTPGIAAIAVTCLALGIGANTAVFSVFNALLLKPLPYQDPDRLLDVFETNPGRGWRSSAVCPADFQDWRSQTSTLAGMAAYRSWAPNLTGTADPERLVGLQASGALFSVLGVQAAEGRTLLADDETNRARVVVVSHGLWRRAFGSDPRLVGRSIRLNGEPFEVVGIMPPGFQFPDHLTELWTPLLLPGEGRDRGEHELRVVARLGAGIARDQASGELAGLMARIDHEHKNGGCSASLQPLRDAFVTVSTRRTLWLLVAAVTLVLLIASANVANILLAHGATREREMAVRLALGATRRRVIAQQLTESVALGLAGAWVGLGVSVWVREALLAMLPESSAYRLLPSQADWRVVLYAGALCIASAILFGIVPAVRGSGVSLTRSQAETRTTGSVLRGSLLVVQTALALTLLAGAGLLIRTFLHVWRIDPGFTAGQVVTARINLPPHYPEAAHAAFFTDVLARLRTTPDVHAAGAVTNLPLGGTTNGGYITFDDRPAPPPDAVVRPGAERLIVSPGYFDALRIRLQEGRVFTDADAATAAQVVVVNRTFASTYWPGQSALGRRIKRGTPQAPFPWLTIVGVVEDVKHGSLTGGVGPTIYLAHGQTPSPAMTLVVRADASAGVLAARIRSAVRDVDRDLPVSHVRTLDNVVLGSLAWRWLPMLWMAAFALLALALAALGTYGVVSYAVARRTREFGIRVALGAEKRDLVRLAVAQGLKPVALGGVIGLAAAVALTRALASLLYGITPVDLPTYGIAALLLITVAFAASLPPARRVARQDPVQALRQE